MAKKKKFVVTEVKIRMEASVTQYIKTSANRKDMAELIKGVKDMKNWSIEPKGTDDVKAGRQLVKRALEAPLRQIAVNAGHEGGVVVERVRESDGAQGFNAADGTYADLLKEGIIDPAKVTRSTLQNAASIAALLITTEALVAEEKTEEPAGGHAHGGGMEGMM